MKLDPLLLAFPLYSLLIAGEWALIRGRPRPAHRWEDLLANIGAGLGQLATDILLGLLYVVPYVWLLEHVAPARLPAGSPATWVIVFVAVDFLFYWQHRVSHRVGLFWAAHVVHHQGEFYNLTLALRQPWFSAFVNWAYYLPLALIGVPIEVFLGSVGLNLFYQFFLHTRLIGRLGPLEWVLNTPSHHRVHHGRDDQYLDANYGGVFVIWDRLFGTYRAETQEPDYGTVQPFRSWNPVWANFEYFSVLRRKSRACTRLSDRVLAWLRPPEWWPPDVPHPRPEVAQAPRPGTARCLYASLLTAEAMLASILLVLWKHRLGLAVELLGVAFVICTLAGAGGLLDRRRWAGYLEGGRRLCTLAGLLLVVLVV